VNQSQSTFNFPISSHLCRSSYAGARHSPFIHPSFVYEADYDYYQTFHFGFEMEQKQDTVNQLLIAEINEFRTKVRQKTANAQMDQYIGRSLKSR
jgi:hypothetical protein